MKSLFADVSLYQIKRFKVLVQTTGFYTMTKIQMVIKSDIWYSGKQEVRYCSNLRRATPFTRLPNVRGVHDLTRRDLGGAHRGIRFLR